MKDEKKRTYRSASWFGKHDKDGFIHRSWMRPRAARGRLRRPAGHRHLQHLVGADAVQRALPRAGRARQARRLGGGRPAVRVPGDVARARRACARRRCCSATSSAWTSRSRSAPTRSTASCCSAAATRPRPRSSWARPAATCRRSSSRAAPMLNGKYPRPGHRVGHRRLALQRGGQGRHDDARRSSCDAESCMSRSTGTCNVMGTASTMAIDGRGARPGAAAERRDSGRRFAPLRAGPPRRPPHRRAGARGRPALADPDARGVRERDPRQRRASAARPTPSSTCWRSPAASACR